VEEKTRVDRAVRSRIVKEETSVGKERGKGGVSESRGERERKEEVTEEEEERDFARRGLAREQSAAFVVNERKGL
jgi:hypothetical protein